MIGGRLCLCQFLGWIDSPRYHCHPQQALTAMGPPVAAEVKEKFKVFDVDDYLDDYENDVHISSSILLVINY